MPTLTTEKLTAGVGAVVEGLDRERLLTDDALPEMVLDALEQHGVLVFPGLHLDDATQVAFSRRLGRVEVFGGASRPAGSAPADRATAREPGGDGARAERAGAQPPGIIDRAGRRFPEIFRVTLDVTKNPAASYLKGTFDWHIDGCTDDIPIMATLLAAHAVAATGGETEFASTYAAYDALTDEEKQELEHVRVVHSFEASQLLHNPNPAPEERERWRQRPPKTHPLVWQHRSGRKSLVLGATTAEVVGMAPDAGRALLDDLLARATAPDRVYRHHWAVGDAVMWDNRGVLHRACPYDTASPRDMHRTTFAGDEPIQ